MRRVLTALTVLALVLAGGMVVAWVNRVPLAEWAIATYQPETPLGPVAVRIKDISLSSITFAEIRTQYRGPISIQDASAHFSFDGFGSNAEWHVTLTPIRIGSLNAALSFADWFDLLDTLQTGGPESSTAGSPELPLSIGDITVETIDLYVETPKGYALLNGHLALHGTGDLSQPGSIAALLSGIEGDLLLSAGAAGFPVGAVIDGGNAMGRGSLVLTVSLAGNTAKIEAITPISVDVDVAEPLPGLPGLPVGTYQADIGTDDMPFRVSLGYGLYPTLFVGIQGMAPFPFSFDTPYGTAAAQAKIGPKTSAGGIANPLANPFGRQIGMKGAVDLSRLPMPGGGDLSVGGGFELDLDKNAALTLDKGFRLSADLGASSLIADLPPAAMDILGTAPAISADSNVVVAFSADQTGQHLNVEGALAAKGNAISVKVANGFGLTLGPRNDLQADVKSLFVALPAGKTPVGADLFFNNLTVQLAPDGSGTAKADYRIEAEMAHSTGTVAAKRVAEDMTLEIESGLIELPEFEVSVPRFNVLATHSGNKVNLSGSLDEVWMGALLALKRPLSLTAAATLEDWGVDFSASGSIDKSIAVTADGSYVGGDVTLRFRSGDIPLGPGAADLSELTDLVDLGRSDPNGSIRVGGELTYQNDAVGGYADLHIAEIGSVLADGTEISVLGTVTFDLSRPPATMEPATLTGVLSSDILGRIPFEETFTLRETGEMAVQSLEAQILGGTVSLREGLANPSEGSLAGQLHAAAINLEALADLMQIEGLEGTGRLTGDLKFHVTEETVVVQTGALAAESPGILRYRGEALRAAADGNENLALLVQALENFHYEVLTLGIDIPEFGEGIVTLHLEGNNPDVLDGYPFDVTINLESEYGRLIKEFLQLYQKMDVILEGAVR